MVRSHERGQYVGGAEGAPPPPPPGGYRGAVRVAAPASAAPGPDAAPRRPSVLGWSVLGAAIAFAFVLLIMWAAGATAAIYGVVTLALQLALVVAVVAALVNARARTLGAIALAVALVVNVGTIGAASALRPGAAQQAGSDPEDDHWAAYPGIKGQTEEEILERASLEEVQATAEDAMAAIRERLTEEFGFAWVPGAEADIRAERNGYGGESMLVSFSSDTWSTVEPVRDHALKLAAMAAIEEVLYEFGFYALTPLNDPSTGFDPDYLVRFYGSDDPRTQTDWEWYTDDWPGPMRFYANVTDLTHDADGSRRAAREAVVAGTDEPVEGLRIGFLVPEVLSESDRDEFATRMDEYPY
ncbi:hypothetical protein H4J02_11050 [Protaetiibacter sp. SSC-01]|uniref:hypothetical protein n=1 Tax=Protaetiibacter sp. SSC-01 TaxID=2759943 RepID=UPI001656BA20|nr:hypothetical protein [Protaetiibacter sp. SSC-01]QNO36993.1 hypothetical protein H4J02_11050 [Protaetiibacter sp. SSC-01]